VMVKTAGVLFCFSAREDMNSALLREPNHGSGCRIHELLPFRSTPGSGRIYGGCVVSTRVDMHSTMFWELTRYPPQAVFNGTVFCLCFGFWLAYFGLRKLSDFLTQRSVRVCVCVVSSS